MIQKRPIGVTLIGYFYVLGAAVLIISLLNNATNEIGVAARFGVPWVPESVMIVVVSTISLIMSYGYLKLKPWGFWLMMVYTTCFFIISFALTMSYNQQPYIGNMVWSVIVAIYSFLKRKTFTDHD